jgi:hypothetical protein
MWTDSKYRVWTTLFSKAVDELPECYDKYKAYVKKKEGMQPGMFGSPYTIIEDARHGVLTRKTMEELKDIWAEVSDIPYECLEYIFDNRIDLVEDSLYKVWNDIFERQEFAKAYHMHSCNIWLESVIGKQVYDTLGKCFEIYKLELSDGKEAGIFKDIHSAEQAADRYDAMAAALKELDAPETKNGKERGDEGADSRDRLGRDAVAYFLKSGLSVEALAYIIENECKDPEYAADRWEKLIGEL